MTLQRHRIICLVLLLCSPSLLACKRKGNSGNSAFPEKFEQGAKRGYSGDNVPLATGVWRLDGALIGKTDDDVKQGEAALRIAAGGHATMGFNILSTDPAVTFSYAVYGKDGQSPISLWYSTDSGAHWQQAGSPVIASSSAPATASFTLPVSGAVRFSIHNDGTGRVNVDDFNVGKYADVPDDDSASTGSGTPKATRDNNMALGNPSNATSSTANKNNYLLMHPQYTLSYSSSRGMANWVSWHLSTAWRGAATRCNCFLSDTTLPAGFYRAISSAYIATGFDRGHLCPSEDRTASAADNAATFLMSNMTPQSPILNQQPWARLEDYARTLSSGGMELYIVAGGYGVGGNGSKGGTTATIAGGRISVPAHYWKVIVVLPVGTNDVHRITKATRVIAVDMPNVQSANSHAWDYYRTSVKSIEQATGYMFFSKVPNEISAALKSKVDSDKVE